MELLIILSHTTASIQEDHEPTNEFFGLFYQLQLLFFSVPVLKLKLSMDIFPKDIFPKDIYPDLSWYKKVKIKKSHCNYFEYTDVFCHSKINRYNNSMIDLESAFNFCIHLWSLRRKDGRAVECGSLENCWGGNSS